ncbi:uncharacterized protein EI90DRAFT_2434991 [Cantharellus anzutake]|uniref:uncharacterized protein n=1 Tax=Cantharellus anzutake TaxID=1750568 RepID=UPI0019061A12|nr:uncharacterized protein EI90DRAFT_2434991 [Cantharellus anzutake]KAF8338952.1 hypothetical protein EI90DRAFT_2434991 [Cantharellus anzutake]
MIVVVGWVAMWFRKTEASQMCKFWTRKEGLTTHFEGDSAIRAVLVYFHSPSAPTFRCRMDAPDDTLSRHASLSGSQDLGQQARTCSSGHWFLLGVNKNKVIQKWLGACYLEHDAEAWHKSLKINFRLPITRS